MENSHIPVKGALVVGGTLQTTEVIDFANSSITLDFKDLPSSPHVGRVAQREKKFNQFYCLIIILGYKRNSKLLFMKKNLEPSWRYHLTHTANSAQIWQNFIAVYHQPSNMAQDFISLLPILSSFFIPKS